ncbi:hypothetical protein [uncultured Campylobacter sp.]|uniref:hypothetical protein n=1 Tax=uncultured Campylobacter sp. TaxID=218934 RepID=UPI00261EFC3C|nr:hypothetical protein [uncultured Campylobacter sp.]
MDTFIVAKRLNLQAFQIYSPLRAVCGKRYKLAAAKAALRSRGCDMAERPFAYIDALARAIAFSCITKPFGQEND